MLLVVISGVVIPFAIWIFCAIIRKALAIGQSAGSDAWVLILGYEFTVAINHKWFSLLFLDRHVASNTLAIGIGLAVLTLIPLSVSLLIEAKVYGAAPPRFGGAILLFLSWALVIASFGLLLSMYLVDDYGELVGQMV